ncbi:copper homeostasis protein CutC [Labrenzia sp. VG12]|uniref:copper homeostasis protein CutC n=1 Tax=Labrenzia sp. VG12 TaxID=2021862 RepID=UPI000B8C5820|nr:copper homeostasis protein CutC [Labrenzia sp. VG12]ASP32673.1 copper homeostasis protein CutC [Labrenzia sp. VG12]
MTHIPLEVCVDTLEGAWVAAENGADRIELCSALSEGGLTPSLGVMTAAAKLPVPVYVMIRPRRGGFAYSDLEKAAMLRDIEATEHAGLAGIVLGAVDEHHALDRNFLSVALKSTRLPATLHRAIDTVQDYGQAIEDAIALGFERILTSGQADKAELGMDRLHQAARIAAGRLSIMAGSGVNAANAARILRHAGVSELHASCSKPKGDVSQPSTAETRLGFVAATGSRDTDAGLVQALRHAMDLHAEDAA